MADVLESKRIFIALTRPQMFAGVTYSYFVANGILAAEMFLISKSFYAILIALVVHLVGVLACLHEPRFFDIWITKVSRCPRVPNFAFWRCNSYRP